MLHVAELYAELIESGLEFTRAGHRAFYELCTVSHHSRNRHGTPTVCLRLQVSLLEGINLHTLLMSGSPLA